MVRVPWPSVTGSEGGALQLIPLLNFWCASDTDPNEEGGSKMGWERSNMIATTLAPASESQGHRRTDLGRRSPCLGHRSDNPGTASSSPLETCGDLVTRPGIVYAVLASGIGCLVRAFATWMETAFASTSID